MNPRSTPTLAVLALAILALALGMSACERGEPATPAGFEIGQDAEGQWRVTPHGEHEVVRMINEVLEVMALELAQHSKVRTFLMPSGGLFLDDRPSHEDLMSPLPAQSAFLHAFATTFTELAGDLMTEAEVAGWNEFVSELEGER